jgi:tRNA(fMet)-specific endonuclease VapC
MKRSSRCWSVVIPAGTPILLDTNILIYLARGGAASERLESRFGLRSRPLAPWISVVTAGEMLAFAERNGWGTRRMDALKQLMSNLVVVDIRMDAVLNAYAAVNTHMKRSGTRMNEQNDVWIAATAAATGAVLLTTDHDFDPLHPAHLQREWIDPRSPA